MQTNDCREGEIKPTGIGELSCESGSCVIKSCESINKDLYVPISLSECLYGQSDLRLYKNFEGCTEVGFRPYEMRISCITQKTKLGAMLNDVIIPIPFILTIMKGCVHQIAFGYNVHESDLM